MSKRIFYASMGYCFCDHSGLPFYEMGLMVVGG